MKQIDPCNGLKIGTQKIKFRLLNFADGIFLQAEIHLSIISKLFNFSSMARER